MPNKMSSSYYPGSRKLFQAPLSNSFLLSFLASSNWEKKDTPLPWFNLWLTLFFPDLSPVSLGSWERMPGPEMRS